MAVFRVEKTKDFTIMSNYHLRDKNLSLKAKGLLSQMLSLPEEWDYTLAGLAHINKESKDAIRSAVNELEQAGYITRRQTTTEGGRFGCNEYLIRERPVLPSPLPENPTTDSTPTAIPMSENPTQLNINSSKTEKEKTELSSTDSLPISQKRNRTEVTAAEMQQYRDSIAQNISYDLLRQEYPHQQEQLEEILEILVETVCTTRQTVRVAGNNFPAEVVKARLMKLTAEHIRFVLGCLSRNTTKIRNIRQYLLTTLYNAPTTIDNYYAAMVSHDLAVQT
ncbi:MAG: DUF6017 domain-containing protein [Oscillospiraceae bacterium]|nr:DUF6017 domain-containing protein [Oscillospiraceae bacterium]